MCKENTNVFLIPGTGQKVKNYGDYKGLDIWIKGGAVPLDVKYFIGHSLGVNFILNTKHSSEKKFIFINPLIKKRNCASLFMRWIKFHIYEGIKKEKLVPMRYWMYSLWKALLLLRVNVYSQLRDIPRENVIIIRGTNDNFFCDKEDLKILYENNFKVIEVDAGHDWNKNVANAVAKIINE